MKKEVKLNVASIGNGTKLFNSMKGFVWGLADANNHNSPVAIDSLYVASNIEDENAFCRSRELKAGSSLAAVVRCAMLLVECAAKEGVENNHSYTHSATLARLIERTSAERKDTDICAERAADKRREVKKAECEIVDCVRALAANTGNKIAMSSCKCSKPSFADCMEYLEDGFFATFEEGTIAGTPALESLARERAGADPIVSKLKNTFVVYNTAAADLRDAQDELADARKAEEAACRNFYRVTRTLTEDIRTFRARYNNALKLGEDCTERETLIRAAANELAAAVERLNKFKAGEGIA